MNNIEAIPASGPVIFVPNHQNAFLDAILVVVSTPRFPWSIARASAFKKQFVAKLLTSIRVKTVFRFRDGMSSLRNNDNIFKEWAEMLVRGEDITIFAEGNHNEPYAEGTLQKGFARMALLYQQTNDTPVSIVPVGLHYESHHSFRSRVLVNFGNPINVKEIANTQLNEREKLDLVVERTDRELKARCLAIPPDDMYQNKVAYLRKNRIYKEDMVEQLAADRKVLKEYPLTSGTPRKKSAAILRYGNPIVWVGFALHVLPYSIFKSLLKVVAKDPQFIGSFKYALGTFLLPPYYLLLLGTLYILVPNLLIVAGAGLVLPFLGIATVDWLKKT
jgi:1-acyl-sn-glycerol-3-phosphate acyltransferase